MEETQLKNIVRRITQQVIERLIAEGKFIPEQYGVLAIVPNFIPEPASLTKYLRETYQSCITCALFEDVKLDKAFETVSVSDKEQQQLLLSSLKYYNNIVLAMPAVGLLKKIAQGDDTGFVEQLVLRSILLGKSVTVILDYIPPKFKRGTFFESIIDAIDALKDMGAEIVSLQAPVKRPRREYSFVTETEVITAHENGEPAVICTSGAIVTPLAIDKAKELDVTIER